MCQQECISLLIVFLSCLISHKEKQEHGDVLFMPTHTVIAVFIHTFTVVHMPLHTVPAKFLVSSEILARHPAFSVKGNDFLSKDRISYEMIQFPVK